MNLRFSPDSLKDVKQAVSDAVMSAFAKGSFRMTAAQPTKRSPLFNWHKPLRQMYKHMVQPPDFKMMGMLSKAPKYKEGGVVQPSPMASGTDSVLAWLDPGEIVTPKKELKKLGLHPLSKGAKGLSSDVLESAARVETLFAGIQRIKKAEVAGVGGAEGIRDMKQAMHQFQVEMKHLQTTVMAGNKTAMLPLVNRMGDLRKKFKDIIPDLQKFRREEEDAGLETRGFIHDLRDYAALFAAGGVLKDAQAGFHDWITQAQGIGEEIGIGPEHVKNFAGSLFSMNQTLGLSKDEMYDLGKETMKTQDALGLAAAGAEDTFTAMNLLSKAGLKDTDMLKKMAPIVNSLAKTTGLDPDSLAKQMYDLTANFGLGVEGATVLEMTFRKLGSADSGFSITADQLSGMVSETENLNRKFADLGGPDVQLRAQQNMAALSSVLSANFLKGFDIRKEMDDALGSGDFTTLMKQTGMDAASLVNVFSKRGGAIDVVAAMQQRLTPVIEQLRESDNMPGAAKTRAQQLAVVGLQGMGFKVNMADLLQFRKQEEKLSMDVRKATGYFQDQSTAISDLGKNIWDVQSAWDSYANTTAVKVLKRAVYPLFLAMDHFHWETAAEILVVAKLTKATTGLSWVWKVMNTDLVFTKAAFKDLFMTLGRGVLATGAIGLAIAGFGILAEAIMRCATTSEDFIDAWSDVSREIQRGFGIHDPIADLTLDANKLAVANDAIADVAKTLSDKNALPSEKLEAEQKYVALLSDELDTYRDIQKLQQTDDFKQKQQAAIEGQKLLDNFKAQGGVQEYLHPKPGEILPTQEQLDAATEAVENFKDIAGVSGDVAKDMATIRSQLQAQQQALDQMIGGGADNVGGTPAAPDGGAPLVPPGFTGGHRGGYGGGGGQPKGSPSPAQLPTNPPATPSMPPGPYSSGKQGPPLYVRSASGIMYSMSSDGDYFTSDPTATLSTIPYSTMMNLLDNGGFTPSTKDSGATHFTPGMSYSDWAGLTGHTKGTPKPPSKYAAPPAPAIPAIRPWTKTSVGGFTPGSPLYTPPTTNDVWNKPHHLMPDADKLFPHTYKMPHYLIDQDDLSVWALSPDLSYKYAGNSMSLFPDLDPASLDKKGKFFMYDGGPLDRSGAPVMGSQSSSGGVTTQPSVSQGTQTVTPTLGTTPLSSADIGQTINQVAETADPTTHDLLQQVISAIYSIAPGAIRPQYPGANTSAMPVNPGVAALASGIT